MGELHRNKMILFKSQSQMRRVDTKKIYGIFATYLFLVKQVLFCQKRFFPSDFFFCFCISSDE